MSADELIGLAIGSAALFPLMFLSELRFGWKHALKVASVTTALAVAGTVFLFSCTPVGGRAPSPSRGVATATPVISETAPARPLVDGSGEDGGTALRYPPASTVTVQALREGGSSLYGYNPSFEPTSPTVTASPADGGALTPSVTVVAQSARATGETDAGSNPAHGVTPRASFTFEAKPETRVDSVSESAISALIAASPWPQYLWGTVECLVERESRGVATAVGLAGEHGLMQIHPATWGYLAQFGITPDGLFDPATNFRAGWELYLWAQRYQGDGFQPWNGGCA